MVAGRSCSVPDLTRHITDTWARHSLYLQKCHDSYGCTQLLSVGFRTAPTPSWKLKFGTVCQGKTLGLATGPHQRVAKAVVSVDGRPLVFTSNQGFSAEVQGNSFLEWVEVIAETDDQSGSWG